MNAMTEAREYAISTRNPVIVQVNCVRIGSHSNSDKHTLYRDENELEYVKEADPLMKFRWMLLRYKRLTEEELLQIEAESKKELSAANRKALAAPEPDPKSIYDFGCPNLISRKNTKKVLIRKKERRLSWSMQLMKH